MRHKENNLNNTAEEEESPKEELLSVSGGSGFEGKARARAKSASSMIQGHNKAPSHREYRAIRSLGEPLMGEVFPVWSLTWRWPQVLRIPRSTWLVRNGIYE